MDHSGIFFPIPLYLGSNLPVPNHLCPFYGGVMPLFQILELWPQLEPASWRKWFRWRSLEPELYWDRLNPSTVLEATTIRWQAKLVREVRMGWQWIVSSNTWKAPVTNGFSAFTLSVIAELLNRYQALFWCQTNKNNSFILWLVKKWEVNFSLNSGYIFISLEGS